MVICLERGADLHTVQLMPLLLTVSCSSKIQIGFTFLVPAHLGSPGKRLLNGVCVWVMLGTNINTLNSCFMHCVITPVTEDMTISETVILQQFTRTLL